MARKSGPKNPLRWLFVLRESDELTSVTYYLFAVAGGLIGFVVLSILWPRAMRYYTDAEYKDWIISAHPSALASAGEGDSPFKRGLDDLLSAIEHGNPTAATSAPIAEAASIRKGGPPCEADRVAATVDRPQSFGEVPVYPNCVSVALEHGSAVTKEEMDREKIVFDNFASYVVSEFGKHSKGADAGHIEQSLASTIGLSDSVTGASFDVPWIYVANKSGSIAVFPGTTVIADPSWKASSRPWWQETFGGQLHLASDVLWHPGDRLTVTYLDVLTNTPTHVRTYLRKFDSGQFVVAIDLYHRDVQPLRSLALLGIDITKPSWRLVLGVALVISFLLCFLVRWISPAAQQKFVLVRARSIYGNVTGERLIDFLKEEESTITNSWETALGKYAVRTVKEERKKRIDDLSQSKASTSVLCRGFEEWLVSYQTYRSWRLIWRFASIATRYVGVIELTYGSAVLPKTEWLIFDKQVFLKTDEDYFKNRLLEVLQQNADSSEESLETPAAREDLESFAINAEIPDYVLTAVVEPQKLSAVRQRRAYLSLDDSKLAELYDRASNVKAVILLSYFERLFLRHQTNFLSKGKQIIRLVLFPNEDAVLKINEDSRAVYEELRSSSRTLKRVNATLNESPKPVYDFAIIETGPRPDDRLLIVTTEVSESRFIDRESPRESPAVYRVDCYVSWRPSDLRFYEAIFDDLSNNAIQIETNTRTNQLMTA
jgi:hypothetical protein